LIVHSKKWYRPSRFVATTTTVPSMVMATIAWALYFPLLVLLCLSVYLGGERGRGKKKKCTKGETRKLSKRKQNKVGPGGKGKMEQNKTNTPEAYIPLPAIQ